MKALAVLLLLLGVAALLQRQEEEDGAHGARRAVAVNYAVYRNAVFLYVYAHTEHRGAVPLASLALPAGWRALRPWAARVDGGRCYVYGAASPEEVAAVREIFRGSFALGMASGGRLVPQLVAVPAFIPDGCLVSVTEVR